MFHLCLNNARWARNVLREHPAVIVDRAEFCWEDVRRVIGNPLNAMPAVPLARLGRRLLPPPAPRPNSWDHLIYAYIIENTGIFDILEKAGALYKSGGRLPPAGPAARRS